MSIYLSPMKMYLLKFDTDEVLGIYGKSKNYMPGRARYLHPDAAASYLKMSKEKNVKVSDMFRTAESSLNAVRKGRGAQPPGYSGHNFGFSIDIEVTWMMKSNGFKTKKELDLWMESQGWFCHRRDHKRNSEEWHYNYFGTGEDAKRYIDIASASRRTWAKGVSSKINDYYGHWWYKADSKDVQKALSDLKMYDGDLDGKLGPRSKNAIKSFQSAWSLKRDGIAGVVTKRVLMLITCKKQLVEIRC